MSIPTPRTDERTVWPVTSRGIVKCDSGYIDKQGGWVPAAFARELERELTVALHIIAELQQKGSV